ncbi:MAG: MBOAT family protein [Planctomycetota bacterium]
MLFHTWVFAAFFAVVLLGHVRLRHTPAGNAWLLVASYVFYGWWNPLYLVLIVGSTALDFAVAARIPGSARPRAWLVLSLVANLGLLGFFKYAGFVTDNVNALLLPLGWQLPAPDVLLPVGISFFTFQSMSYTIDVYRGQLQPEPSFVRFAAFVALFPQLVAGPIERASHLLPQLRAAPRLGADDFAVGAGLFVQGLFKKVVLADWLAQYVDRVYAAPAEFQAPALWAATFAFAWQIYFDFSGYTDMARGVARSLGYRLMVNFDRPYTAVDLGDFWRRWHISLSTWFRDYVYVPLGGNRRGRGRMLANVAVTMVLSGLWHGAAWGFLLWGALHAVGRIATLPLERSAFYRERVPTLLKQAWVFLFVTLAWVPFRAPEWATAGVVYRRMFTAGAGDAQFPLLLAAMVLLVWALQLLAAAGVTLRAMPLRRPLRVGLAAAMLLWLLAVARPAAAPFLYFQF